MRVNQFLSRFLRTIVGLAILGLAGTANATTPTILFDNGSVVEDNLGLLFNSFIWTVYEDFELTSDSIITDIEWSQFDQPITYTNTVLTLFNGIPKPSTHIATFSVVATRVSNGLMLSTSGFGVLQGYDYSVNGLSQFLPAGTYYVAIHNIVSGGQTLWANTTGTPATIPGAFQHSGGETPPLFGLTEGGPKEFHNKNFAFRLVHDDSVGGPFTNFTLTKAEVEFDANHVAHDQFKVQGDFTLVTPNDGINFATDEVEVTVGPGMITIPAESFMAVGSQYKFDGILSGVEVKMTIKEISFDQFSFTVEAKGIDLTDTTNPVDIVLKIGNDAGSANVRLQGKLTLPKGGK